MLEFVPVALAYSSVVRLCSSTTLTEGFTYFSFVLFVFILLLWIYGFVTVIACKDYF